ncbi:MAG: hypothetical protein R2932_59355 [Caldilineaceae bacterium]
MVAPRLYALAAGLSYLLTGPVFALNLLLLAALATYRYGGTIVTGQNPLTVPMPLVYGSALLGLVLGVGLICLQRSWPNALWQHLVAPARWLVGLALGWALLGLILRPARIEDAVLLPTLLLAAIMLAVALLLALVILGRGVHWLLGERRAQAVTPLGPPLTLALFTMLVQYALWVTVIPTLWTVLLENIGPDPILDDTYASLARTDGIQWVATILVSLVGLISLRLWRRRTKHIIAEGVPSGPDAEESRRVIVDPMLSVAMAVITLAATIFVVIVGVNVLLLDRVPAFAQPILDGLKAIRGTSVAGSLLLLLIPIIGGPLRLALDLVNDIITYVDQNEHLTALMAKVRPPIGAIRPRFRLVLDYLQETEQITQLVVIAHSQGSVIALDELAATGQGAGSAALGDVVPAQEAPEPVHTVPADYGKTIRFVTMGSPISHLYQHYFPGAYPPWSATAHWQTLFGTVRRWCHFYRIDDFVGMRLYPLPTDLPPAQEVAFDQAGICAGGHTEYWQDDRFVAALRDELAG